MKLRLKGHAIRVRLDRRDIERLIDEGHPADAVRFRVGTRIPVRRDGGVRST